MKKTEIIMNNPVYLGLSILDKSKFKMHEFWYDYLIPNIMKRQNCVIWTQIISLSI